jgi:uncharacterized protein (TIGR02145 family)/prepilin-type N-terminal cleavage/methylation domain-containing protein
MKNLFFKPTRRHDHALSGFTLVELIVVIAIIALLVTLSLIALTNARMASRDSKRMADIKQIQTALDLFYDSQDRYPTDAEFQSGSLTYFNGNLGTTTYISIPTPPAIADGSCSEAQNAYSYNVSADGSTYTINFCTAKPVDGLPGGKLIAISGGIVAGCYPENDADFCSSQNKDCSVFASKDNCGQPRTANCGVCTAPLTCGVFAPNQCSCASESNSDFCTRLGAVCGILTATDNCGHSRTVADCGATRDTSCTGYNTCGAFLPNQCGCQDTRSDADFCTANSAACGSLTHADNCGQSRTVADCGLARGTSCISPQICGSGATANQCVCAPETDSAFCTRLGAVCGILTGTDNCGHSKTVADCGVALGTPSPCTLPLACNGGGVANQCGFTCGTVATISTTTPYLGTHICNPGAPDYDTCAYDTVTIGTGTSTLCWMKQNMNIGTKVNGITQTGFQKSCYNDATSSCPVDGAYYQWSVAMQSTTTAGARGICPSGWHIPTEPELHILEDYLKTSPLTSCIAARAQDAGDCSDAGTKLKEVGTYHWLSAGGTNSSSFTALASGAWYIGSWQNRLSRAYFWSSTQYDSSNAYGRYLWADTALVYRRYDLKTSGFSVRCVAPFTCLATETDSAFCARLHANCGNVTAPDNCGVSRTVNCGTCSGYDICGGTNPNQCGFTCGTTIVPVTSIAGHACNTGAPDYDTCSYGTVQIGTQCWMSQNMNVGAPVCTSGTTCATNQTNDTTLQKYCYNNTTSNCTTYGGLYQWGETVQYFNGASNTADWVPAPAGNVQGICPTDWHLPTDAEQNTLDQYLNDTTCNASRSGTQDCANAGTKLRTGGFAWKYAGDRESGGGWYGGLPSLTSAAFWSSSVSGTSAAWTRELSSSNSTKVGRRAWARVYGYSVRCLHN